ncbi:MAG: indole-3-glycerol-phosphate synthase [Candidatus Gastranaerophilales bacterium]|nr:indole-3-glycerol-phosphate synthase [Candidatus Gastranaerophilales bacterium]
MFLSKMKKIKEEELANLKSQKRNVLEKFNNNNFNLISEIKKASPSLGDINTDIDILKMAKKYIDNNTSAISVLCEKEYFKGSIEYLKQVRNAYPDTIILCKDFIIDDYQIYEAKLSGADIILIILAFSNDKTPDLIKTAHNLGLEVLLEVHTEEEMQEALKLNTNFIGVNNRNLKTLKVDLDVSRNLAKYINNKKFFITESGLKPENFEEFKNLGYKGALVGTYFMERA